MYNDRDSNYVSVGTWMWIIFLTAIPIVGVIVILLGAFIGENESRRNYFRAILAWFGVLVGIAVIFILLGSGGDIMKHIHAWSHKT
jgi:hypothetical protein